MEELRNFSERMLTVLRAASVEILLYTISFSGLSLIVDNIVVLKPGTIRGLETDQFLSRISTLTIPIFVSGPVLLLLL
jgi:hypothetical protein